MNDFLDNLANDQYRKMHKKRETEEEINELAKSIRAYQEAAKADAWLFGDYDAYESYGLLDNGEEV
tara:strand:+ start:438 stop:635 length:198 start_codon:yes stop_codon:yes gene_type:complete